MKAPDILKAAAGHMQDRAATYDKPEGERSMSATVGAFKCITGHALTEEQGWLFMEVLKAVRSQQGGYRADSYEDGAAYAALAGEAAYRERGAPFPDTRMDLADERMNAIARNGNDGAHYPRERLDGPLISRTLADFLEEECTDTSAPISYDESCNLDPVVDMSDPKNWLAGDWVECVNARSGMFCEGRIYRLGMSPTANQLAVYSGEERQVLSSAMSSFRFHARPDADGWIKWDGERIPTRQHGQMIEWKGDGDRPASVYGPTDASELNWHGSQAITHYRPTLDTASGRG